MPSKKKNELYGTGRRKTAIARVWLTPGEGNLTINGREAKHYLGRPVLEILVRSPLVHLSMESRYDVRAFAHGGGLTGQAGAVKLGIARALLEVDEELRKDLRAGGFLTRDAREKERKKYGRKKARRGFQFVKR
ncbi:MAG: 30S ribosomal protein S9 [Fimbriimonas ginsengisoli]|uniref:Small ribosomal subunit protein uS9 n=1 Tax=Fimbriimonas ginsengisoli TaxID=1005039 RepID=A0A931PVB7_FIMGI|nr:30S ribosomal protein S9 [Fimbriimonas ginsengisoli]